MRVKLTWQTVSPAAYWGATYALRGVLRVVVRWKVTGRENVPATGGFMVVANHMNNADPPILGAAIARRRIRFMAKIELFKWPFGIVPRLYGAFPVRRFEADLGALLNAERLLKRGEVVGMFPEGTRSRTGYLGTPHPGTAAIALHSGATVLPCAIAGTEILRNPLKLIFRPTFSITIGEPIVFEKVRRPTPEQVTEATERIFGAIRAMVPPRYLPPYTETGEAAANGDNPPGE